MKRLLKSHTPLLVLSSLICAIVLFLGIFSRTSLTKSYVFTSLIAEPAPPVAESIVECPPSDKSQVCAASLINQQCGTVRTSVMPVTTITDPAFVGQWGPVQDLPIAPIHTHVLPNGKVLAWAGYTYDDNLATSPYIVWDPASNPPTSATSLPSGFNNLFCSGHSFLPDGRLLVTGGQNGANLTDGIKDTAIYDFQNTAQPWSRGVDMRRGRWYPTNITLSSGEQVTVSGSYNNTTPPTPIIETNPDIEIWQSLYGQIGKWKQPLAVTYPANGDIYPWLYLTPDGTVFQAGPAQQSSFLDTIGSGAFINPGFRGSEGFRSYGSSVMYDEGKILIAGGGSGVPYSDGTGPYKSAQVINLKDSQPTWSSSTGMMMNIERRQHNAVVLPDGKVLVVGGSRANCHSDDRDGSAVYSPEMWSPATQTWTLMAPMLKPRVYHSTAMLLPDGRVLATGGSWYNNDPGQCQFCYYNRPQKNMEIYSPPYLFSGVRPTITSAPSVINYRSSFFVGTANASAIHKISLIKLPSVTHSFNQDQHTKILIREDNGTHNDFEVTANGLSIKAPVTGRVMPPGYYMLFIVNDSGIPSVAKIVQIKDRDASFRFDYDGDWRSNIAVFRPSNGEWTIQLDSTNPQYNYYTWGINGDMVVPGDYDGDQKTDIAVFRPSNREWSIVNSFNSSYSIFVFGQSGALPVPADYDGDGKTDAAVWQFNGYYYEWAIKKSSDGTTLSYNWGTTGDKPLVGDFDGDKLADITVFRPSDGTWYIRPSSTGVFYGVPFGMSGDIPVPGDYDGDGKTDIAVFRPSTGVWTVLQSSNQTPSYRLYGLNGDIPIPGDYDGDGKTDIAIWRPSTGEWATFLSSKNISVSRTFGLAGDIPIPSAFINR